MAATVLLGATLRAQEAIPTTNPTDLASLQQVLLDANLNSAQREEAAKRLLGRGSPQAKRILLDALKDLGNKPGQLAVARALAGETRPDQDFKIPLGALLESERVYAEAAAYALAQYKGDPEVFSRLSNVASAVRNETSRIAAIRGLGRLFEKRAAETLMTLLQRDTESQAIRNASADALVEMTGLKENSRDVQRWWDWWQSNRNKDDTQWRLELLQSRVQRQESLRQSYQGLVSEMSRVLSEQPAERQGDTLIRFLISREAELRRIGAASVEENLQNNKPVRADARQQLRNMVGDSSTDVRLAVASALRAMNDADSLPALLAQLEVERDSDVRREIVRALSPIRSLKAGDALLGRLDDPSLQVAGAAADALRELGKVAREQDPAMANRISDSLDRVVETRKYEPGFETLQISCVDAMIPLRDVRRLPKYYQLLNYTNPRIRRSALKALGELQVKETADTIVGSLNDPDADVRLEAINALSSTATFAHAENLWKRLRPADEPDQRVREAAWKLLETMLPSARQEQLYSWAERFKSEPARQIVVNKVLLAKLFDNKQLEGAAVAQQNIGDAYMRMTPPNATEAATYFESALNYWRRNGAESMVTERLVDQRIRALLAARDYAKACQFGSEMITWSDKLNQTIGAAIRSEVERLRDAAKSDPGDLKNARQLIAEAQKMHPPLAEQYDEVLKRIKDEIGPQPDSPTTQP